MPTAPHQKEAIKRCRGSTVHAGAVHAFASILWLACCLGFSRCDVAHAAEPASRPEHQIQALYLYNFTKYVDWPATAFSSPDGPIVIALIGAEEVRQDLEEITRAKTVNGRPVVIRPVAAGTDFTNCHMLFIGSPSRKEVERALQAVSKRPVLTVGVADEFLNLGGMILLSRRENKLNVRINLEASHKAQLNVSAKLMLVARQGSGQPGPAGQLQ